MKEAGLPLGAAVIGCGVIGPSHAKAFALDERVELLWACDKDASRHPRVPAPRHATELAEVLADPRVRIVSIGTPHHDHAATALAALAAGKHVILEKPLARTPAEIESLVAASKKARSNGQRSTGVFQHRHAPLARRLHELASRGDFGRIRGASLVFRCKRSAAYYATDAWRGKWATEGGGTLINQAIHSLDLMFWWAGAPVAVKAKVERRRMKEIEVEDWIEAEYELENGVIAKVTAINEDIEGWNIDLRVEGDHGHFASNDGDKLLAWKHPSKALTAELEAMSTTTLSGVKMPGKADYGDHHSLQWADFISSVIAERDPMISFESAGRTAHAVLATYHSAALGGARVAIPDLGDYRVPAL